MSNDENPTWTFNLDRLNYAREKLFLAVADMADSITVDAGGAIRLQQRLRDACTVNLVPLSPRDFPDDLRPSFDSIRDRMTSRSPIWDEGTISATVMVMPEDEVKRLIVDIVSLYGDVCEAMGRLHPTSG